MNILFLLSLCIYSVFVGAETAAVGKNSSVCGKNDGFNITAYYEMPPLYLFDDYDRCLEEFPLRAIYCLVDGWIAPNETNAIWPMIRQFSADSKRSFRHDRLQRGLCMNRCKKLIAQLDGRSQMKYFLARFEPIDAQEITFDPNTFRGALDWRNRYRRLANQCVNYELKHQYSLMAYTTVEYCTTNDPNPAANAATSPAVLDVPETLFLVVLAVLLLLTLVATVYDWSRYRNTNLAPSPAPNAYDANINQMSDYYRSGLGQPGGSSWLTCLLVAFSLPRNWHELTTSRMRLPTGGRTKDLRFLQSVRFLIMFLVIAGHSMLFNCIFPLLNPQYVELNYRRMITMLIFNGITVVQTYFTISGFLLSVHFVDFVAFHLLWYASLPVAICLLGSAYIFYAYDFEKPAVWIALYAALSNNFWGALFAVLFVGLAFDIGGFIRGVLNNPIFHALGKTTYCAFLCHLFVIRVTLGNVRQPIYVSDMRIVVSTLSTLVLAYIMGCLMYLLIEIPFSNVQKILFSYKHENVYKEEIQLVENGDIAAVEQGGMSVAETK